MSSKKRRISTEPLLTLGGGPRSLEDFSYLQLERLAYTPRMPAVFDSVPDVRLADVVVCFVRCFASVSATLWDTQEVLGEKTTSIAPGDAQLLKKTFPRTFGSHLVSFSSFAAASTQYGHVCDRFLRDFCSL
jgi:hypothetical protein